jgi:hypothetical protein
MELTQHFHRELGRRGGERSRTSVRIVDVWLKFQLDTFQSEALPLKLTCGKGERI